MSLTNNVNSTTVDVYGKAAAVFPRYGTGLPSAGRKRRSVIAKVVLDLTNIVYITPKSSAYQVLRVQQRGARDGQGGAVVDARMSRTGVNAVPS